MPKDYAQKKAAAPSQKQHRRGSIRALLAIALLLALGWLYSRNTNDAEPHMDMVSKGFDLPLAGSSPTANANPSVMVTPSASPGSNRTPVASPTPSRTIASLQTFEPLPSVAASSSPSPSLSPTTEIAVTGTSTEDELYLTAEEALAAFQFYQLTQETPDVVDVRPPSARSQPLIPERRQQQFVVQAASFSDRQDADNLRAQLILAGIEEARVDRIEGSNGVWYRVIMGPLDSRSRANAIARQLRNRNMNPLVRAIDL